ncbi:MAG: hydroxymethylbilane synthase [Planctomycetota bacterium]
MSRKLRLGTRASQLATTQSTWVARKLEAAHPGTKIELVEIRTTGDADQKSAIAEFTEVGVFTKQLEAALLDGRIDIAVHSLKDLPTVLPEGLSLAAVPEREDPSDVLVTALGKNLAELPSGTVIGTGSPRRRGQIAARYPGLNFCELRGNIDTRIAKTQSGDPPAAILARAGIARVGRLSDVQETLSPDVLLPAPGQGALGIETRSEDHETTAFAAVIECRVTRAATHAERELLRILEGGCRLPLGALATADGEKLTLRAVLAAPDGSVRIEKSADGTIDHAGELGAQLAEAIQRDPTGRELLDKLR